MRCVQPKKFFTQSTTSLLLSLLKLLTLLNLLYPLMLLNLHNQLLKLSATRLQHL